MPIPSMLAFTLFVVACTPIGCITIINVEKYGAKGDGKTVNTVPLQNAINAAANVPNGAEVYFPKGVFLTGPLRLASKVTLNVSPQSTIRAINDIGKWPVGKMYFYGTCYTHFLYGLNITDAGITGGGTVDGQGAVWWKALPTLPHHRPFLVICALCERFTVKHIHLMDAPMYNMVAWASHDVEFGHVHVTAPSTSPNTDGCDAIDSHNIHIHNLDVSNGDDGTAISSYGKPSENILVENCVYRHGHGASIGSLIAYGVRNITFRNIVVYGAENGCRVKCNTDETSESAIIRDIVFHNFTLYDVDNGLHINMYHNTQVRKPLLPAHQFSNITFSNIVGKGGSKAVVFDCNPSSSCTHVKIHDVTMTGFKDNSYDCRAVSGKATGSNFPRPCV